MARFDAYVTDEIFNDHVTLDMSISKPKRGFHIGRHALKQAVDASQHNLFIAHLRKTNFASKKVLTAVGFQIAESYPTKQLCMIYRKETAVS